VGKNWGSAPDPGIFIGMNSGVSRRKMKNNGTSRIVDGHKTTGLKLSNNIFCCYREQYKAEIAMNRALFQHIKRPNLPTDSVEEALYASLS
jgi:hypothetical protein